MSDDDTTYFAGRAAQERRMAERSTDAGARDSHRQLADLYAVEASRQDRGEPPAGKIRLVRS